MFHTRSLHHIGMSGTDHTLACWRGTPYLVTLDAKLASKRQFGARPHGLRLWPRVVSHRGQVGPRNLVHCHSKTASVLGPDSGPRTEAVFGSARTTFQGSTCAELSKVRVTLETLIDNVAILFISYYDSTSHTQFVGHHARTHGPPRRDTHTCFGIGRASDS